MTQYSLFGAEARPAELADLDGLVVAGGQWVRSPAGARVSVVVADRWRADAVHAGFAERGIAEPTAPVVEAAGGQGVRTAFDPLLLPHAARWTSGSRRGLPADFALTAGGLRLWAIAGGAEDDAGYRLRCVPPDDPLHGAAGAALARMGVAAVSIGHRGSAAWRVTSVRRRRRLAELLGPPPPGAGADWPGGPAPAG